MQRTLVALHDNPDSGADTLVDQFERKQLGSHVMWFELFCRQRVVEWSMFTCLERVTLSPKLGRW
jgi:hypothetical protein